jgi:tRNA-splicing ligase RtcB
MKEVCSTEKLPIKIWATDLEDVALQQAKNLANLPFAFKHIALMPDAHMGYGMPIGGVLATKGVVIPSAVGVDIGCGMITTRLPMKDKPTQEQLKLLMNLIRKEIPLGYKKHSYPKYEKQMPTYHAPPYEVVTREWNNARKSLGTLGSGNHFIEIQYGSDSFVYATIHSGSRNLGKQVCDEYNKMAVELNRRYFSEVPKSWELAFLPMGSPEGRSYIEEMEYCVNFAMANRRVMMKQVIKSVYSLFDIKGDHEMIECCHNYAQLENHFGSNVMVHRKGATSAKDGELGIIPGSQGSMSYIIKGKGNKDSFESCSHGAGRAMGRKQAQRELDLDAEIANLDSKGIVHSVRTEKDLDEATSAYKDIEEVMNNQQDLVETVVQLQPLAVIKG